MIDIEVGSDFMVMLHMLWAYCQVHTDIMEAFTDEWALKL